MKSLLLPVLVAGMLFGLTGVAAAQQQGGQMQNMPGMDAPKAQGMDHSNMPGMNMQGMDHSTMKGMLDKAPAGRTADPIRPVPSGASTPPRSN